MNEAILLFPRECMGVFIYIYDQLITQVENLKRSMVSHRASS
jgi:hypothetical protein